MNHVICSQFLREIDEALESLDKKQVAKARQLIIQVQDLGVIPTSPELDPLLLGKIWAQECPSIINFSKTLMDTFANRQSDANIDLMSS